MQPISRLKRIEDKKNKQQALLFIFLTIGFLALVVFIGSKFFIQIAVLLGDLRSSSAIIDNGDNIPPAPPRVLTSFEATNSAQTSFGGVAEAESTVTLILNGKADKQVMTDDKGIFQIGEIELSSGDNVLAVYATDKAGNESSATPSFRVLFDNKPPVLKVTAPENGADYYDDEREIVVAGETDEDAHVRVNDYVVAVDTEGSFVKRLQLVEGVNDIEIKAYDDAGNEVVEKLSVKYSR